MEIFTNLKIKHLLRNYNMLVQYRFNQFQTNMEWLVLMACCFCQWTNITTGLNIEHIRQVCICCLISWKLKEKKKIWRVPGLSINCNYKYIFLNIKSLEYDFIDSHYSYKCLTFQNFGNTKLYILPSLDVFFIPYPF